jgi:O-antigen ligase
VGRGLGVVGPLAAQYASSPSEGGYEDLYLDTAAQIGVLGAVALIGILCGAAVSLLRRRSTGPESAAVVVAVGIVFLLLALAGVLASQLFVLTSLGFTWLFVGAVLGSQAEAATRAQSPAAAAVPL